MERFQSSHHGMWHLEGYVILRLALHATKTILTITLLQLSLPNHLMDGFLSPTNLILQESSSLVRLIATNCGIDIDLGIKGKSGILHSMKSRAAFLTDISHRIHFIYTSLHSSWFNQIECWFSILARRLLRRGNFTSTGDLKSQILRFIDYFNRTFAKPFAWKFLGYPNPASTG